MSKTIKANKKKRGNILLGLTIIFLLIAIGFYTYYKSYGQYYETTDNAYVHQNITYVSPQISGVIDRVFFDTMQPVKAGDVLAHIDTKDRELALENAKNDLAQAVRNIKKSYKEKEEISSQIHLNEILLAQAKEDLDRNTLLFRTKAISQEQFNAIKYRYQATQAKLQIAKDRYQSLMAILGTGSIADNPIVQKAVLALQRSYINLQRCTILAPIDGRVAKKNVSPGSAVSPATKLAAIVPQTGFWVDANYKETQLKNIRVGQKAKLYSDLYGRDVIYHGTVEGISSGTGSVFSLLPAQNATGNWIKVVQRIPVRIALDPDELAQHPLHVGNSMTVTIDTHDRNGTHIASVAPPKYQSDLYAHALHEAQTIAQTIIQKNL